MDVLKIKQFLSGNGCGYGDGSGIKNINGYDVYEVDNTPTIFTHIHGNVAKGYILERNVILKPCYIVKGNGYFAHGETLEEAQEALHEKIMDDMDVGEKLAMFRENFPEADKLYPLGDFYDWHHILTGSCEMGRKSFVASHGLDLEKGEMTVREIEEQTEAGREIFGVADPAIWDESRGKANRIISLFEKEGIYFDKADNRRLSGKMQVHNRLKFDSEAKPGLYVFSTCVNTIRTIPTLIYSQKNVEDVDTDCEDHIYDALRYFLMCCPISAPRAEKEDMRKWTPLGWY